MTRLADGDPRPARRQARYEEILAAAWDIAAEQGLSGVSLHEVARTVGLRQPSLYAYIESKSALYDAMFAQAARRLLEHARSWSYADDARLAVRDSCLALLDFIVHNPPASQLLFERTIPGFEPSPASYAYAEEYLAFSVGSVAAPPASPIRATSTSSSRSSVACSTSSRPTNQAVIGGLGISTPCWRCSSPTSTDLYRQARHRRARHTKQQANPASIEHTQDHSVACQLTSPQGIAVIKGTVIQASTVPRIKHDEAMAITEVENRSARRSSRRCHTRAVDAAHRLHTLGRPGSRGPPHRQRRGAGIDQRR